MISALRARVRAPVFSHFRFASGAVDAAWSAQFADAVATIPGDGDAGHEDSATHLRSLLSTKLLSHTAIRDEPEQFFEAHRLLAKHSVDNGPGFWIRYVYRQASHVRPEVALVTKAFLRIFAPLLLAHLPMG